MEELKKQIKWNMGRQFDAQLRVNELEWDEQPNWGKWKTKVNPAMVKEFIEKQLDLAFHQGQIAQLKEVEGWIEEQKAFYGADLYHPLAAKRITDGLNAALQTKLKSLESKH